MRFLLLFFVSLPVFGATFDASKIVSTDANKDLVSYAGSTPCSSQAMTALSSAGVATCTSVDVSWLTGAQDLTRVDDTNVTLTLGGTPTGALLKPISLTLGWSGTLAAARLNANVVQGVTNDTNVTGSIAAQNLTLGWSGTLAATRLNSNVVQSVVNDTNVTGSIATQALTLGWTGTLGLARGGTNADLSATGGASQVLKQASAGAAITVGTVAASEIASGAALTKADDTNVTLTLGGSPTTALLAATSITAGWTGQLGLTRGGTAANLTAANGGVVYSTAAALAINTPGNSGDWLKSVGAGAPAWTAPAALTKADDTNVTLTLGGSASTSLLNAASITAGWSGQLATTRGGTGLSAAVTGLLLGNGTSYAAYAGTSCTNQFPRSLNVSGAATCASVANADLAGSIAATKLVGTDIATVGTITSGTWNGTAIATQYGGTGQNWSASSGIPLLTTGTASLLSSTGSGNVVRETSPTLTTPNIGDASGASVSVTGELIGGNANISSQASPLRAGIAASDGYFFNFGVAGTQQLYGYWTNASTVAQITARNGTLALGGANADALWLTGGGRVQFMNGTEPTCNSTNRGTLVLVQGGAGVADTFRICTKDAADAYGYRALF